MEKFIKHSVNDYKVPKVKAIKLNDNRGVSIRTSDKIDNIDFGRNLGFHIRPIHGSKPLTKINL